MNMLKGGFSQFISGIFANWQMILFILLAVIILLTVAFRKFKVTFAILLAAAIAIAGVLIVNLITQAVTWNMQQLADFAVRWVPTIIFTLTILLATILGASRGLRKSLIFLTHEIVIGIVCIVLYVLLVKLPQVDGFMLKLADAFSGGSIAARLGVTAECSGLKEVFAEWLPTVIKGDLSVMLGGSKAYILTLADLIYHIAFAVILLVLYAVLNLIMLIIYHCCYSERKYKIKREEKFVENRTDRRYHKHSLGGGVVGAVRGTVIALLTMSFLGTALYIVAGRGDGKFKETELDGASQSTQQIFSVYRSVESYGSYGIFKVLNAVKSPDNVPYYLFAADVVLSGELDDEEFGISEHIVFREELSAYTTFARDTVNLMLKYGEEDVKPILNGKVDKDSFNKLVNVMSNESFRTEFDDLISEFDAQTYIINFALSFVNTAIANIDDVRLASSISASNRDLLKLLFTKGYLSESIPDEKLMRDTIGSDVTELFYRPYLDISKLVNKGDVRILYGIVMDVLTNKTTGVNETLNLVAKLLPRVQQLTLLGEEREAEINPVLGRLYCYAANKYLTAEESEGISYASIYEEKINWVGEINNLIDVADSALSLYGNLAPEKQPLAMVNKLFDKADENYEKNNADFDVLCDNLASSKVLGRVLSTSKIYNLMYRALNGMFNGIYVPSDLVYENTYDADGNLVSFGEMYRLFNGMRMLGRKSNLLNVLDGFDRNRDMDEFLTSLSAFVQLKDGETPVSEYLTQSGLLRSVMTAALVKYGDSYLYVPKIALESDALGNKVNLITESEIAELFANIDDLTEFVRPILSGGGSAKDAVADFVRKDVFKTILNSSKILEGSVAKTLVNALANDNTVIISRSLVSDLDAWVSDKRSDGELKKLLNAVEKLGLDTASVIEGSIDKDTVVDNLLAMTTEDLDECLKSSVMHYTVSNFLLDGVEFGSFKIIVPLGALKVLEDDVIEGVIKKSELTDIISVVGGEELGDNTDVSKLLKMLVNNKKALQTSYVLAASTAYSVTHNADTADMLKIPQKFDAASSEALLKKLNSSNPWKEEIVRLVDALDEVFGISTEDEFNFDENSLKDKLSDLLKNLNNPSTVNENVTRLSVCYASEIVCNNINIRLDELVGNSIDKVHTNAAKSNGYYTRKELEALSNALNIFEIDVTNLDSDKLTEEVKDKLLGLNEPAENNEGKTKLNVIYPSVIIIGMLSNELDEMLLKKKDTGDPMIEETVLNQIKGGNVRYSEEELCHLIDSVRELGVEKFDDLDTLDVNDIKDKTDRVDEICRSYVVKGVLTKQISESNELGVEHALAYESEIKVLRNAEIKSVINLVNEVGADKIEDMYFDDLKLSSVRKEVYESDGRVKSYLLLKAVSNSVKDSEHLIVNHALIDSYDCIQSGEMLLLMNAFTALEGDDVTIRSWSEKSNGEFSYPTKAQRQVVFESEIACAKLTEQIILKNNSGTITSDSNHNHIGRQNLSKFRTWRDAANASARRPLIATSQLHALFDALDVLNLNGSFTIPQINLGLLQNYAEKSKTDGVDYLALIFASDFLRYKACDAVSGAAQALEIEATEEATYRINDISEQTKSVYTLEQLKELISRPAPR